MSDLVSGGIGFAPSQGSHIGHDAEVDETIYRTAVEAARRKFSPEFMNRIDKVLVFRSLKEHHLQQILELELQAVEDRIMSSAVTKFPVYCSDAAKEVLLRGGIDYRYVARHLKRSIERFLVHPLSNLMATGQVAFGDSVYVGLDGGDGQLVFSKPSGGSLIGDPQDTIEATEESQAMSGVGALPLRHAKAVGES